MARIRVADVEAVADGLKLSSRQVHRHAARLAADGLLVRPRVGDGVGAVIVITPQGVREAGHYVRSRSTPSSITALRHGRGVSWIAAGCERRGRDWYGPLELKDAGFQVRLGRRGSVPAKTHLPDLGVLVDGERWAVEFERTQKAEARVRRILDGYKAAQLAGDLDSVFYVCGSERIEAQIERVARAVELNYGVRRIEQVRREVGARKASESSLGMRSQNGSMS